MTIRSARSTPGAGPAVRVLLVVMAGALVSGASAGPAGGGALPPSAPVGPAFDATSASTSSLLPLEAPVVFHEDFDAEPAHVVGSLQSYAGGPAAHGTTYTADPYHLPPAGTCSGLIVSASVPTPNPDPANGCGPGTSEPSGWVGLQRMAAALGRFSADEGLGSIDDIATNRALVSYTVGHPGGPLVALRTNHEIPVVPGRTYAAVATFVGENCHGASPRWTFQILDGPSVDDLGAATPGPCDDPGARLYPDSNSGDGLLHVARIAGQRTFRASSNAVRLQVTNTQPSGSGNDGGLDDLMLLDVTPELEIALAAPSALVGSSATLSYRIATPAAATSPTDVAFVATLPPGVHVADEAATTASCPGLALEAALGGTSASVTGTLPAGAGFCVLDLEVVSRRAGTVTFDAAQVAGPVGVRPTGSATATFGGSGRVGCGAPIAIDGAKVKHLAATGPSMGPATGPDVVAHLPWTVGAPALSADGATVYAVPSGAPGALSVTDLHTGETELVGEGALPGAPSVGELGGAVDPRTGRYVVGRVVAGGRVELRSAAPGGAGFGSAGHVDVGPLASGPQARVVLAFDGAGALWVIATGHGATRSSIVRIDAGAPTAATASVLEGDRVATSEAPIAAAAFAPDGSLWTVAPGAVDIVRLDVRSGQPVGAGPDLAVAPGSALTSCAPTPTLTAGLEVLGNAPTGDRVRLQASLPGLEPHASGSGAVAAHSSQAVIGPVLLVDAAPGRLRLTEEPENRGTYEVEHRCVDAARGDELVLEGWGPSIDLAAIDAPSDPTPRRLDCRFALTSDEPAVPAAASLRVATEPTVSAARSGDGTWSVDWTVTVANDGPTAQPYAVRDALDLPPGVVAVAARVHGAGAAGANDRWDGSNDTLLGSGNLQPGDAVTFAVGAQLAVDADSTGPALGCTGTSGAWHRTSLLKAPRLASTDGCFEIEPLEVRVTRSGVHIDLTVTNPAARAATYDLVAATGSAATWVQQIDIVQAPIGPWVAPADSGGRQTIASAVEVAPGRTHTWRFVVRADASPASPSPTSATCGASGEAPVVVVDNGVHRRPVRCTSPSTEPVPADPGSTVDPASDRTAGGSVRIATGSTRPAARTQVRSGDLVRTGWPAASALLIGAASVAVGSSLLAIRGRRAGRQRTAVAVSSEAVAGSSVHP